MAYDPRTGKKISSGTTQDFSKYKGTFNYDSKTGKKLDSVIQADTLSKVKPFNVTPPAQPTGALGMSESLASNAKSGIDTYTQNLKDKAAISETGKNSALDEYISNLKGQEGEVEMKDKAYKKTLDPIESELNDINQQILSEQHSNRRRIEALEKNPGGMFKGALLSEVQRINKESLSKQADLSVIQMGLQGRYDSAKEIADRAIAVKLEQQRTLNEALKFNYEENKELFNKDEQRAFEAAQNDRERALDKEEEELKTISDMSITALQNGAPTSIASKMRAAKTVEEAIRLGGGYLMSISDRIKQQELNTLMNTSTTGDLTEKQKAKLLTDPTAKATTAMISVNALLDDYRKMVAGFGNTPSPAQRKSANSYLTNVLGPSLAVAQGQGALQKDEADRLIESLGVRGLKKREKITMGNIDSAIQGFRTKIETNFDFLDSSIPGASDNFEVFKNYKINSLPPAERAKAQTKQAIQTFQENDLPEEDIVQYFVDTDPVNGAYIQQLFLEGYELEEIINSL